MDLSTLQSTVVGLKTAADIAKSFLDLKFKGKLLSFNQSFSLLRAPL